MSALLSPNASAQILDGVLVKTEALEDMDDIYEGTVGTAFTAQELWTLGNALLVAAERLGGGE